MKLDIDTNQSVFVDSVGNVCFCHYSATNFPHLLKLSFNQFINFNDVLRGLEHLSHFTWHPLAHGLWFHKKNDVIKLVNNKTHCYFQFYPYGWDEYKRNVHRRILSSLRHVAYTTYHQPHARNDAQSSHSSRGRASTLLRRKQTASRATRNVGDDYEDHSSKSSTFSRRKNTNTRPHFKLRRRTHARRDSSPPEESSGDGDVSSNATEDNEYGSEPAVTLGD